MSSTSKRITQLQHALSAGRAFQRALVAVDPPSPALRYADDTDALCNTLLDLQTDLEALLHRLTEKRNVLLSSIYRLHDEIFEQIFLMCTFRDPKMVVMQPNAVEHDTLTPLALSWVSRRWREVALRIPALWTNVELCVSPSPANRLLQNPWHPGALGLEMHSEQLLSGSMYASFLERSRKDPLDFTLDLPEDAEVAEPLVEEFVLANKDRAGPRILHLKLPSGGMQGSAAIIRNSRRCLRAVQDTVEYIVMTRHGNTPFDFFLQPTLCRPSSKLEGLSLCGVTLPTRLTPGTDDLHCRFLSLDNVYLPHAINLLAACPRIEEFVLRPQALRGWIGPSAEELRLPNLRKCSLTATGEEIEQFFTRIRVPRLHTLKCQVVWSRPGRGHEMRQPRPSELRQEHERLSTAIAQLEAVSDCVLQALSLKGLPLEFYPTILEALPSLKSLQYHVDDDHGDMDKTLLQQMSACKLCPMLEEVVRHGECHPQGLRHWCIFLSGRLEGEKSQSSAVSRIERLRLPHKWHPRHFIPALGQQKFCADVQKSLAGLVDVLVIGNVVLHKETMEWFPTTGSTDWLQTWTDDKIESSAW
ncbi:hypothetical protein CALCODRAFT_33145 [Calocera cornea HHB12733]|uniref:F-box domain-containing protein n=1 Tax=Calocera cornea HHB12733 TaxID=1353952 RepID=A0A165E289_9BASI|nr:hypothetical protein CALCODRAFT_33145 [Calocera cornea HHB12733]